jgi:hypothetical protein
MVVIILLGRKETVMGYELSGSKVNELWGEVMPDVSTSYERRTSPDNS